jgi:hypothetical protein
MERVKSEIKKISKEEFLNEFVIKKECSGVNEVFLLKF